MPKSETVFDRLKKEPTLSVRDIRHLLPSARPYLKFFDALGGKNIIAWHYDAQYRPRYYDSVKRLQGIAQYHIDKNWGSAANPIHGFGIMYHLSIDGDGVVYILQPLELRTWHIKNGN